jgi:hypothetical protein
VVNDDPMTILWLFLLLVKLAPELLVVLYSNHLDENDDDRGEMKGVHFRYYNTKVEHVVVVLLLWMLSLLLWLWLPLLLPLVYYYQYETHRFYQ